MQIALFVHDSFSISGVLGAFDVLHRLPDMETLLVGVDRGTVRDLQRVVTVAVHATLDEVPHPDVLVVSGRRAQLNDERLLSWIERADRTSTWTAGIGYGTLVLAKAGVLRGVEAATHWAFRDELAAWGAVARPERVVERGKVITSAGSTGATDLALTLAMRLADPDTVAAIQLWIEYDPHPPLDSGTLAKASDRVVARASELLARRMSS